ncbi:MAG: BREX-3 system phosphatase PglZ [Planctomyces sp.]|jgi:hypothetical protein
MDSWRDKVLRYFQPGISRLTLVADPDGLLTEERMLAAIRERGFELIPFDDPIAFRFAYESQYRSVWDRGEESALVVVLRSAEQQLDQLPFDLLGAGRRIELALHQLFSRLNHTVLASLDRSFLDDIERAGGELDSGSLTEKGTRDFVLMHCFGIVPSMIRTAVDLMKVLLSLHSRCQQLPELLLEHLLERMGGHPAFQGWPLRAVLSSRELFLAFVQEQWHCFVTGWGEVALAGGDAGEVLSGDPLLLAETTTAKGRRRGPGCLIPFAHEDIRAYVDTLFLDGSLTPVMAETAAELPQWVQPGVVHDEASDSRRRFQGLWRQLEQRLPDRDCSHRDWQEFARKWAELVVLRWSSDQHLQADDRRQWDELHLRVELEFGQWMIRRYGTLHNLPCQQQPAMVHQIPWFMATERKRRQLSRLALVVLDGLALDQWLLLKRQLDESRGGLKFQESTAFAWVPTLTSVTRQSIFAGEPPLYFPDSLGTTAKERAHWLRFWEDQGVPRLQVELLTSLDGERDERLDQVLLESRVSVLGLVWNKVDEIMHGMQLQTAGMHSQVRLWGRQGHLGALLRKLVQHGFQVYLTADHGNVAAVGAGNPRDGVLAETRGKRCRVYDRVEFRDEVAQQFPQSISWPGYGLPAWQQVLLAGGLQAFAAVGEELVGHGGVSLEEVLVPFVTISGEVT